MTRYSKERLEKGICPICKKEHLRKTEFNDNVMVIYHYFFGTDKTWRDFGDPEMQFSDHKDYDSIEYSCPNCKITFHVDSDSFVEGG